MASVLENFVQHFRTTPTGLQIEREAAESEQEQRKLWSAERDKVQADLAAFVGKQAPVIAALEQKRDKAKAAFDQAAAALQSARYEERVRQTAADQRIAALEKELRATAPEPIGAALRQISDRLEEVRHMTLRGTSKQTERGGFLHVQHFDSKVARDQCLRDLLTAREAVEALCITALHGPDLEARIRGILDAVTDPTDLAEV